MRVTELRLRESIPIVRGTMTVSLLEKAGPSPNNGWKMTAINWGVRIEKQSSHRGAPLVINRIIPWDMVKYAEVAEPPK